jgi:DNA-binding beta-propeller fold protein YncE
MFYSGDKFPEWQNSLFVGALTTRQLQRISFGQPSQAERREGILTELGSRIRDVVQGPDGYIYVATEMDFAGTDANGAILRLEPFDAAAYSEVNGWADFSSMSAPGNVSSVAVDDRNGRVWIAARCGANDCTGNTTHAPVIGLDIDTGRATTAFGTNQYVWPHGINVDQDGNVWVTDGRAADGIGVQVIKYSPDGRELMRLGHAGVAGDGPDQFSGPTDVAIASDGSIYVTDGHEADSNNRVMKFSADGEFIMSFGEYGSGPGQFAVPHAIAIDSRGRLFVADRDNGRVQIFTADGEFIDEWTQFGRPSGIEIGPDDTLYVSDNQSNDERNPGVARGIRIGDALTGAVHAFIPDPEFDPARAQETMAHGVAADAEGAVYGAEVWGQIVRKYVRTR